MSGQESNVYSMEAHLIVKLTGLLAERQRLQDQAAKISKRPDPMADPFARPIMEKAAAFDPQIDELRRHIVFIRNTQALNKPIDPIRAPVSVNLSAVNFGNIPVKISATQNLDR